MIETVEIRHKKADTLAVRSLALLLAGRDKVNAYQRRHGLSTLYPTYDRGISDSDLTLDRYGGW